MQNISNQKDSINECLHMLTITVCDAGCRLNGAYSWLSLMLKYSKEFKYLSALILIILSTDRDI